METFSATSLSAVIVSSVTFSTVIVAPFSLPVSTAAAGVMHRVNTMARARITDSKLFLFFMFVVPFIIKMCCIT